MPKARGSKGVRTGILANDQYYEKFKQGMKEYGIPESRLDEAVSIVANSNNVDDASAKLAERFGDSARELPYDMWKFTLPDYANPRSNRAAQRPRWESPRLISGKDAVTGAVLQRLASRPLSNNVTVHRGFPEGNYGNLRSGSRVSFNVPFEEFSRTSLTGRSGFPFYASRDVFTIRNPRRGFDFRKLSAQPDERSFLITGNYRVTGSNRMSNGYTEYILESD